MKMANSTTYLLTSNPDRSERSRISDHAMLLRHHEHWRAATNGETFSWSIHLNREAVRSGDRYLLLLQGNPRKHATGIISCGTIVGIHGYDVFRLQPAREGFFINLKAESYVNPYVRPEQVLSKAELIDRWFMIWNGKPWAPLAGGNIVTEPEASETRAAFLLKP